MHRFVPFLTLFFLIFCLCSCEIAANYVFLISEGTRETEPASMENTDTPPATLPHDTDRENSDTTDDSDAKVPISIETLAPTVIAPPDTTPPAEEGGIVLLSITETVARGKTATLSIRGIPYATYRIEVYYSTTVSSAKGLEPKATDADGTVTWSWRVGTRTKSGSHRIVIRGENGEVLNLTFTTTE